jgi:hypothetical protein
VAKLVADLDKNTAEVFLNDTRIAGPFKLFCITEDKRAWFCQVTEFEVFDSVCRHLAPLTYGDEEIAEAWEILCEQYDADQERGRACLN